jgi:hypothetical protein
MLVGCSRDETCSRIRHARPIELRIGVAPDLLQLSTMRHEMFLSETSQSGRVHALATRLHMLENHALALQDALRDRDRLAEATAIVVDLQRADTRLHETATPIVIADVDQLLEDVGRRLAVLGRSVRASAALTGRFALGTHVTA